MKAILKFIGNLFYACLVILVIAVLAVVILQRASNNSFALGGIRIFNILTTSMVPEYEAGDIIVDKVVDVNELQVGDDISYIGKVEDFAGKIVTHRIEKIERDESNNIKSITTKGIANLIEDPKIEKEQVLGKVIYKVRSLSYISKLVNNLYTMYILIFVPVVIIIFINFRTVFLNLKDIKEEREQEKKENGSNNKNKEKDKEVNK